MEKTQVVVIGGGATGTGILRDLAMRGISAILVEQHDLAYGTSSRFHGLMHSGARYAVNDLESAKECISENNILRKIASNCLEDTGGFFVQLSQDDPEYVDDWLKGCQKAGIPVREVPKLEAMKLEPNLSPEVIRVFAVPDAAIDGFRLVWSNVESAEMYGGQFYTYTRVDRIIVTNSKVTGVKVTDLNTKQTRVIHCDYVINSAGAWAGEIASLAGVNAKTVANKGTLVVFSHRINNRVINRLRYPQDGDIMVPHGTVSIFGTTSQEVDGPEHINSTESEVDGLLNACEEIFPHAGRFRILRSFSGVRPLFAEQKTTENSRKLTRGFTIMDHKENGVNGFVSIVGGKLTTYRLMAEKTTDLICYKLGINTPCRTSEENLVKKPTSSQFSQLEHLLEKPACYKAVERLGVKVENMIAILEDSPWKKQLVCECEQVTLAEVELRLSERENATLNDLRRKTRIGMGPCQGTFCAFRIIGHLYDEGQLTLTQVEFLLTDFFEERWKGIRSVIWGEQLRQAELMRNYYFNLLNICEGDFNYEC